MGKQSKEPKEGSAKPKEMGAAAFSVKGKNYKITRGGTFILDTKKYTMEDLMSDENLQQAVVAAGAGFIQELVD